MKLNTNIYWFYFKITVIPMITFILLGFFIWYYNITTLRETKRAEISTIIQNIIRTQVKKDMLLPNIIVIDNDSMKKLSNDILIQQIALSLSKKYLENDTVDYDEYSLQPYYTFAKKVNEQGGYNLTESQLGDLRNHIDFLSHQVNVAVDNSKDELNRDIDRLNFWISIWIGVIGFLGIFVPIIINIDTTRNIERASEKAHEAKRESEEALEKINSSKPEIEKIVRIEKDISTALDNLNNLEQKTAGIVTTTTLAKQDATEALDKSTKVECILSAVSAISKLSVLDINHIHLIQNPIEALVEILKTIHSSLTNCNPHFKNEIVKNCFRQLGIRLYFLSFLKFVNRTTGEKLNAFADLVSRVANDQMAQSEFDDILMKLDELIDNLSERVA